MRHEVDGRPLAVDEVRRVVDVLEDPRSGHDGGGERAVDRLGVRMPDALDVGDVVEVQLVADLHPLQAGPQLGDDVLQLGHRCLRGRVAAHVHGVDRLPVGGGQKLRQRVHLGGPDVGGRGPRLYEGGAWHPDRRVDVVGADADHAGAEKLEHRHQRGVRGDEEAVRQVRLLEAEAGKPRRQVPLDGGSRDLHRPADGRARQRGRRVAGGRGAVRVAGVGARVPNGGAAAAAAGASASGRARSATMPARSDRSTAATAATAATAPAAASSDCAAAAAATGAARSDCSAAAGAARLGVAATGPGPARRAAAARAGAAGGAVSTGPAFAGTGGGRARRIAADHGEPSSGEQGQPGRQQEERGGRLRAIFGGTAKDHFVNVLY